MIKYFSRPRGDQSTEIVLTSSEKMRQEMRAHRKKEYCVGLHISLTDLADSFLNPQAGPANSKHVNLYQRVQEQVAYMLFASGSEIEHHAAVTSAGMALLQAYALSFGGGLDNELQLSMFIIQDEEGDSRNVLESVLVKTFYIAVYQADPGDPDPFRAIEDKEQYLRAMSVFPI